MQFSTEIHCILFVLKCTDNVISGDLKMIFGLLMEVFGTDNLRQFSIVFTQFDLIRDRDSEKNKHENLCKAWQNYIRETFNRDQVVATINFGTGFTSQLHDYLRGVDFNAMVDTRFTESIRKLHNELVDIKKTVFWNDLQLNELREHCQKLTSFINEHSSILLSRKELEELKRMELRLAQMQDGRRVDGVWCAVM